MGFRCLVSAGHFVRLEACDDICHTLRSIERKKQDLIDEFIIAATLGDQLEICGALSNTHSSLMCENQTGKAAVFTLPTVCNPQ